MWLYIDSRGMILAASPNDMEGNTGWEHVDLPDDIDIDNLMDEHGAAMYMLIDGELVKRSEAERMADWPEEAAPEPNIDVQQLRADVDYIAMETGVELW